MDNLTLTLKTTGKGKKRAFFLLEDDMVVNGVTIPKGTPTDGASIPRITIPLGLIVTLVAAWFQFIPFILLGLLLGMQTFIFPTWGKYWRAVLVHDYYFLLEEYKLGNKEMHRIMKEDGISKSTVYWFRIWLYLFRKMKEVVSD